MCNPGFAYVGLTGASSIASVVSGRKQAKAQQEAWELNRKNAEEVRKRNMEALDDRLYQERTVSGERLMDIQKSAQQYLAQEKVRTGAGGITGVSATELLGAIDKSAAEQVLKETTSLDWTTQQLEREKFAVVDRQYSQVLGMPQGTSPNMLAAFLDIGAAAAGAYAEGYFDSSGTSGTAGGNS